MAVQDSENRPAAATVQMNVRVDPALKERFRLGCASRRVRAQDVIANLMGEWLARESQQQAQS